MKPPTRNDDLGALSFDEAQKVDAARDAFAALKKTFDHWVIIGVGLQTLKAKAERLNLGRATFKNLREQAGLGKKVITDATVTRLLAIVDNLPKVIKWHQDLEDKQQYE